MNEEQARKLRYVDKTLAKAERLLRRFRRLLERLGSRLDRVLHFAGVDPRRFGIDRLFRTHIRLEDCVEDTTARIKAARDTVTDLLNELV